MQSTWEALTDWANSGEVPPSIPQGSSALSAELQGQSAAQRADSSSALSAALQGQSAVQRTEDSSAPIGAVVSNTSEYFSEMGQAADQFQLSKEPVPDVPSGQTLFRLGYFVPHDMAPIGDRIHQMLKQTLESRHMPFLFHKVFVFSYRWAEKAMIETVSEGFHKHQLDVLICVGDRPRLEPIFEPSAEKGVSLHFLSREDAKKSYWRMGLIARIVVKEE
ncbi:MAG: hypothetical protein HY548_04415 [Elusimicrobia bacterium]|nr:hypothetical protein [Elusimicrobiota bacterium]